MKKAYTYEERMERLDRQEARAAAVVQIGLATLALIFLAIFVLDLIAFVASQ